MADWRRPPSPLLPAFSIRDLNGPEAPPGVVQLTGGQYNSTIRSQPDANLRYLDDDDGELITIGSSLELEQRLDEPVRQPLSFKPISRSSENKMMHIFDIQKSAGSLAVWRDHEAYSSKKLRSQESPNEGVADKALPGPSGPSTLEKQTSPVPALGTKVSSTVDPEVKSEKCPSVPATTGSTGNVQPTIVQDELAAQLEQALAGVFEGIQSQLGPLADFLETAAVGLRKAAEKTAEADTTAVENVLTGFKGIWNELGEMGRDFLTSFDEELQRSQPPEDGTLDVQPKALPDHTNSVKDEETLPKMDGISKKVSFEETPAPCCEEIALPNIMEHPAAKAFAPSVTFNAHAQKPVLSQALFTKVKAKQSGHSDSTKNSILDWETSDPDFSNRYPPLLSLRKSKSVSTNRDKSLPTQPLKEGAHASSALSRYPSIGQLEEQSRLKAKFPPPPVKLFNANSSSLAPKKDTYKSPTVEEVVESYVITAGNESTKTTKRYQERPNSSWAPKSLPGSWPEPKVENAPSSSTPLPPKRVSLPASHGFVASKDPNVETLSYRVSSPVSETYSRAPIFPRRFQTVSGTNPAARLNGPFDPLANFPALQPRPQRSQPDLNNHRENSRAKNVDESPPVPGAFPQRSQTVHHLDRYKPQQFSQHKPTLWDNYLKSGNHSSSNTLFPKLDQVKKRQSLPAPMNEVYKQADSWIGPQVGQRPAQDGIPSARSSNQARLSEPVGAAPTATSVKRQDTHGLVSRHSTQPLRGEPGPTNFTWRTDLALEPFVPSSPKPEPTASPIQTDRSALDFEPFVPRTELQPNGPPSPAQFRRDDLAYEPFVPRHAEPKPTPPRSSAEFQRDALAYKPFVSRLAEPQPAESRRAALAYKPFAPRHAEPKPAAPPPSPIPQRKALAYEPFAPRTESRTVALPTLTTPQRNALAYEPFAPRTESRTVALPSLTIPPRNALAYEPFAPRTESQTVASPSLTMPQRNALAYEPFVPSTWSTIPAAATSRLSRSPASSTERTPSSATAVDVCVRDLRSMGYGSDANELARLNVYAGAAAGNLEDAIEMIEEDREAAKELDDGKDLQGIRDLEG